MKDNGWGRIVQIAHGGTVPTSAQPTTGRLAAMQRRRSSPAALRSGVTVNTVTPGMIETGPAGPSPFARKRNWTHREAAQSSKDRPDGPGSVNPRRRHAVAYLASPLADFVNGVNIHMDGGGANIY
jgi:NAD(P)-dependent dehydrogenase (short-subunit alcohol dehydrogenase family)